MPYDSNLDEQVFSQVWEKDGEKIAVRVYSYNNGPKKVQLTRENIDSGGNLRFAKLGRLSKEEVEGILPLIQECLTHM